MEDTIEGRKVAGRGKSFYHLARTEFLCAPEFTRSNDIGYNGIEGNWPVP